MWQGIIFAPTVKAGEDAKKALGLKYWYVTTPTLLEEGRTQRVQSEPRILAVNDPGHDSMSTMVVKHSMKLVQLCGDRVPDVWHVRHSA